MMNDPHALRLTLLIAALHFEWTTGSMQSFESTFLFHKVKLIHMVNKWITERQPERTTCIISQIASLCFIEVSPESQNGGKSTMESTNCEHASFPLILAAVSGSRL